jgi:hypothetical protein
MLGHCLRIFGFVQKSLFAASLCDGEQSGLSKVAYMQLLCITWSFQTSFFSKKIASKGLHVHSTDTKINNLHQRIGRPTTHTWNLETESPL